MRISDWSSDVCLPISPQRRHPCPGAGQPRRQTRECRDEQVGGSEAEAERRKDSKDFRRPAAQREPDGGAEERRRARSEERRVGKEGGSTCRPRWAPNPNTKTNTQ